MKPGTLYDWLQTLCDQMLFDLRASKLSLIWTVASIARNLAGAILPRGTQHPAFCGETSQDIGAGELSWSILLWSLNLHAFVLQNLLDFAEERPADPWGRETQLGHGLKKSQGRSSSMSDT